MSTSGLKTNSDAHTVYRENPPPPFLFFAFFVPWPEGEFKTGLIELQTVDGFIFVGTNFRGLNKNNTFVRFKICGHSILFNNSYRKLKFSGYCNSWIGPSTKTTKIGTPKNLSHPQYKGFYKKIGEWANSRLCKSVSDHFKAKIRLGEFKAVYSNRLIHINSNHLHKLSISKQQTRDLLLIPDRVLRCFVPIHRDLPPLVPVPELPHPGSTSRRTFRACPASWRPVSTTTSWFFWPRVSICCPGLSTSRL